MELAVYTKEGKETGRTIALADEVFQVEPSQQAVYLDVKQYLANQRQGTHKAKERAEINASTRKIKKQKGTGGARAGSLKAPVFVGGGRVFGPRPRSYSFKVNHKTKILARKSALTYKAQEASITIVEDFSFAAPKTKDYLNFLSGLGLSATKTLFLTGNSDVNIYLSARNLPKTAVMACQDANTYAIMNADRLILAESAVAKLQELLNK